MYTLRSVLHLVLLALCSTASAEPLTIGLIVPMTGPASMMGESLNGVARLAHLRNIVPRFEDDRCEGKSALSAYTKLRNEGVRIFYMACSGSILAVAPRARQNGDLILTTYAGSAKIRETGDEVIRLNPDAVSIAEGLAKLLTPELRPTVVLFEEQDYAQSLSDKLHQLLGGDVTERISYRPDAPSYSSEALRIKQRKPRSITFIPVSDGAAQNMLRQLSQNKIDIPVVGEVNLCDYPFHPSDFGLHGFCVSARFTGDAFDKFLSDYQSVVGRPPAYPFYDAMTFDLLTQLDRISQDCEDTPTLKATLLRGFNGRFATYSFSSSGEVQNGGDYLSTVRY